MTDKSAQRSDAMPLVARAEAVINGETSEVGRHPDAPQLAIDQLMKR